MADEKTEQPTPHRLMEARKKGQVAKSNDLAGAVVFVGVFILFSIAGSGMMTTMLEWLKGRLMGLGARDITVANYMGDILNAWQKPMIILIQVFGVVSVVGVAGHVFQTGLLASGEAIKPKLQKINPVEGAKKLFSQKSLLETFKVILRTLLIIIVFQNFLSKNLPAIQGVPRMKAHDITSLYGRTAMSLFYHMMILIFVTGILDYFLQYFMFRKQMMMTHQEVKE